jgi:hypothetical protein
VTLIGWYIVVLFVLECYLVFRAWKKKQFKLGLKERANSFLMWLTLVWICYFIIVSVNFTTNIIDMSNKMLGNFITSDPNNTLGQSLVKGIPGVYILTVLIVALVIAVKAGKGWIGYSEKEKEYLKTERFENRRKVRDFATKYNIPVVGWLVRERVVKENKVIESKGG